MKQSNNKNEISYIQNLKITFKYSENEKLKMYHNLSKKDIDEEFWDWNSGQTETFTFRLILFLFFFLDQSIKIPLQNEYIIV